MTDDVIAQIEALPIHQFADTEDNFDAEGYRAAVLAILRAEPSRSSPTFPLNDENGPWCGCGQPLGHAVPNVDCDPEPSGSSPDPDGLSFRMNREALAAAIERADGLPAIALDTRIARWFLAEIEARSSRLGSSPDPDLRWLNFHWPEIGGDVDDSTWLTCSCGWDAAAKGVVDWVTHLEMAGRLGSSPDPDLLSDVASLKSDSDFDYWVRNHSSGSRALALLDRLLSRLGSSQDLTGLDVERLAAAIHPVWFEPTPHPRPDTLTDHEWGQMLLNVQIRRADAIREAREVLARLSPAPETDPSQVER